MSIKQQLEYKIKDTEYTKTICLKIHSNKGLYIIHRALIQQLNNSRQNTASTKTRSEVRGGGKKPWKQKGTGRARAGSTRSPLWKGGGVTFGPKNRNYRLKINQKEKHLALRTLLYNKFKHTIVIPDTWAKIDKPNTRYILEQINITTKNISKKLNILIIVIEKNPNLYLSIRNLKNINIIQADQINILSLLKAQKLLITANSLDKINEVYGE